VVGFNQPSHKSIERQVQSGLTITSKWILLSSALARYDQLLFFCSQPNVGRQKANGMCSGVSSFSTASEGPRIESLRHHLLWTSNAKIVDQIATMLE